jgi:DNA-binding XRE family transcriptional regulator
MTRNWLWDRKISIRKVKSILKNPKHAKFFEYAALLLARKNSVKEVFHEYISSVDFYQNWIKIKNLMQKNIWGEPRVCFWQAVHEKVGQKLKKKGITLKSSLPIADEFCSQVGRQIESLRKERGLTQEEFAQKLNISQQVISRVESGRQNISLLTLKNIAATLHAKVSLGFEKQK